MMRHSWRLRLRAVISDYHQAGDPETNHAASILCGLFCADLTAATIIPALDAAIVTVDDAAICDILAEARERIIGDRVTAAGGKDDITVARVANDQINAHLCDVEHHKVAS